MTFGKLTSQMHNEIMRLYRLVNAVLVQVHGGERAGSSLHVRNEDGHVLLAERSDPRISEDIACRYDFHASEKTMRLCDHHDHTLSWQSHDLQKKQFPGGVRFNVGGVIIAISGFTPAEDEAAVLWIGMKMGWMSDSSVQQTARISRNTRYVDLFEKFNQAERQQAA